MTQTTRRDFLKQGARLAALMGLGSSAAARLAEALEELSLGAAPVLWLQGLSCSGCSVSFLNSGSPAPAEVLTQYITLLFHSTLSTATGDMCMEIVNTAVKEGGFYLAVEGAIPAGMPEACLMNHEPMSKIVARAARSATAVLAVGSCAAVGGIPAAEGNPTGAVSLPEFLEKERINKPVIRLPGCPCHPDWLVGTLAHVLKFGLPELDTMQRPVMFYGRTIHDQCPRFADYEREHFAKHFSDEGCLFELGCLGPNTHADCALRHWNTGANTCIKAGAPCIGCASDRFARDKAFPFYRKSESVSREDSKR